MRIKSAVLFIFITSMLTGCGCEKTRVGWLEKYAPLRQVFRVDPTVKNTITGRRGTRVVFPARSLNLAYDSLPQKYSVEIGLTEAIDGFDIASTGLPMQFIDELDQKRDFESAGMFRIDARDGEKQLALNEGTKLEVQFPNVVPGEKFRVYRLNAERKWEHHGHNQQRPVGDIGPTQVVRSECEAEGCGRRLPSPVQARLVGVRQYLIDDLTWWNFDYPHVDQACVKGKIDGNSPFEIQTIGHLPRGYHSLWDATTSFKTGAHINGDVTILAISAEDGRIGKRRIRTADMWGNYYLPEGPHNYCQDIGEIELVKVPDEMLKDRNTLRRYLGFPEEKYRVGYVASTL